MSKMETMLYYSSTDLDRLGSDKLDKLIEDWNKLKVEVLKNKLFKRKNDYNIDV